MCFTCNLIKMVFGMDFQKLVRPGWILFLDNVVHLWSFPIFCSYLMMVMVSGRWQKLTNPISLRPVLIVYNFVCSAISLYCMVGFIIGLFDAEHIFQKSPTEALKPYFFMYWVSKNIELCDTVFMMLRHKSRQISVLHIYHHASMVLLSEYAYRHAAWPAIVFILMLNSFIHVLLYFYYALTALNAGITPSWKQRLTELQILQFLIDFVYATIGYIHHGFCIYGLFYGILMTSLFSNFYYHAYLKKKKEKKTNVD